MKSCKLCNEKPLDSSIFCIYHEIAYDNLKSGYKIWNDRYDKLDWKNYLRKLLELSTTGKFVKQVIMEEKNNNGHKE
tara:strand:+ start:121 stop:351 length:231 start_codon:yes stop_codon:yes gene_type:complete